MIFTAVTSSKTGDTPIKNTEGMLALQGKNDETTCVDDIDPMIPTHAHGSIQSHGYTVLFYYCPIQSMVFPL